MLISNRNHKKKIINVVFALLGASLAPSLQGRELDLDGSIELALSQNRQLIADSYNVDQTREAMREVNARLLPRLDAGYTISRSDSPLNAFGARLQQGRIGAADFSPARLNNPSALNNYQPRVALSFPVYEGGALRAKQDRARRKNKAARLAHDWLRQQVVFETIRRYVAVLNAQAQVDAADKARAAAKQHLANVQSMQLRGMAIGSDVMNAEVHYLQAGVHLNQVRNTLEQVRDDLRLHLGLPSSETLQLDTSVLLKAPATIPGEQTLFTQVRQRLDLKALEAELQAAVARRTLARAGGRPHLNLEAAQEWNNDSLDLGPGNFTVGAVLHLNLYDGGASRAELGRVRAMEERLRVLLSEQRQQAFNEVRQAIRRLGEARRRQEAEARAFEQAKEALRIVGLRHAQGLEKTVDLLASQSRFDEAKAEAIQAGFDTSVAWAQLLLVSGQLEEERRL